MTLGTVVLGALVAGIFLGAISKADAQAAPPQDAPSQAARRLPPGEGIFCALAIYSVAREVGRQCFPGEDPEYQAELGRSVAKLDAFVLRNSKTTPAELAKFKTDQGQGAPRELLCKGEAVGIYRAVENGGAERLRTSIDSAVARPGQPTWGTCL
jgi:hypothetical protein